MADNTATSATQPPAGALIVINTCPDDETAERLAGGLVDSKLAACVNIITGVKSVYRWQGEVQTDRECILLIKTSKARYPELETWLIQHHPYELPELLAVPTTQGLIDYLRWINDEVS